MREINPLKDGAFLRELDIQQVKTFYVKILVLDQHEIPIRAIEGRVESGSLSISANSAVRRAGGLTFLAEERENDLTDVDNLLSINKRIKILVGIENHINPVFPNIIWFKQGIFVITGASISHDLGGVTINIDFQDKMCLLNGECGGVLPTSVTFDSYLQMVDNVEVTALPKEGDPGKIYHIPKKVTQEDGTEVDAEEVYRWRGAEGWESLTGQAELPTMYEIPQRIYDIIYTLVSGYGGEAASNMMITDVPLELKQGVRFIGSNVLYLHNYITGKGMEQQGARYSTTVPTDDEKAKGTILEYGYNQDCGYIYTDFVYPGELISGVGESVTSILDKIKNVLGNYEYFYDLDGRFVFREIKNYLNNTFVPIAKVDNSVTVSSEGIIIGADNYYMDLSNISQSIYTFEEGNALVSSYSNNPSYSNIKNDFHIWGKADDDYPIHYHLAIKEKPEPPYDAREVVKLGDGRIRLATLEDGENKISYTPTDWRAELYLRALEKQSRQQRPDSYESEIVDFLDSIYNMETKTFKTDIVNNPNGLKYWIDYIVPSELSNISVDAIGPRVHVEEADNVKKIYDRESPDLIIINEGGGQAYKDAMKAKCEEKGQAYSFVSQDIYNQISIGSWGYSANNTSRNLLYQYTNYAESISLSTIPVYYLDVNSRITVRDFTSGISGDYVIDSISIPLSPGETMSISATKIYNRV